jgi:hypothetical protein
MALVFSPLSEDILSKPPRKLVPKHAFLMRQLGNPPAVDQEMTELVKKSFSKRGIRAIDAADSTGQNDYLERILGLIRSTAFTVAIISEKTRADSLANITLELGLAAMCGKPLIIVKSDAAKAPSDLTRTDWIVYEADQPDIFRRKLNQAIDEIVDLIVFESMQIDVALNAPYLDCAVVLEKIGKAFLLSGEVKFIDFAKTIFHRLDAIRDLATISDLRRLRQEFDIFIRQSELALAATGRRRSKPVEAVPLLGSSRPGLADV